MRVMVSLVSSVHGEEMITCLRIVSDRRSSLSQGNAGDTILVASLDCFHPDIAGRGNGICLNASARGDRAHHRPRKRKKNHVIGGDFSAGCRRYSVGFGNHHILEGPAAAAHEKSYVPARYIWKQIS